MKEYVCECGRVFTEPNKFNGHKSNCRVHHEAKGTLNLLEEKYKNNRKGGLKSGQQSREKKLKRFEKWVSEQHTCEKCGKVMTEKFGSGRFCSRACANSHAKSEESKQKVSESMKSSAICKDRLERIKQDNREVYYSDASKCIVCGEILPWDRRNRKVCSKKCYSLLRRNIRISTIEKLGSNCAKYYFGFYKGIECDSSWELAFLLYHLDKGIDIKRNKQSFDYTDRKGRARKYYPDFIIDNVFYEIKGWYNEDVKYKLRDFPKSLPLVVIDKYSIKTYLAYATSIYGDKFYELYDSDKRSWKDIRKDICASGQIGKAPDF